MEVAANTHKWKREEFQKYEYVGSSHALNEYFYHFEKYCMHYAMKSYMVMFGHLLKEVKNTLPN